MGKPVIAFGHVFYKEFPGVLCLDIDDNAGERIQKFLVDFKPNEQAVQNAVIAYFETTYRAASGDIGVDVSTEDADDNASIVACAFLDQLERFPLDTVDSESINLKNPHKLKKVTNAFM